MNFSESVRISNGIVQISPDAAHLASVLQHKVTVRLSSDLKIIHVHDCLDIIHSICWSPDSMFILCVLKRRGIVQIFSLEHTEWTCKIDEGSGGLLSAIWSPDSRHFLTTMEFYLRITVWSISETSVSYLKYAKACENNMAFSPGGRYLALIERREFRDYLSLFDCNADWELLRNIQLDTQDAVGLLWSPDGRYLVIWDDCLRYRATIYSVDGRHLHTYCAYEPEQDLLGIKSVCWSPTGQLLALGSYDQKCRILNNFNWTCLATLVHPVDKPISPYFGINPIGSCAQIEMQTEVVCEAITGYRPHRFDIYEEHKTASDFTSAPNTQRSKSSSSSTVAYRLLNESLTIQSIKPDTKIPFPKIGIGFMAFSPDGRFLATRNDNAAKTIWIWSVDHRLSLFSLLQHTSGPVCSVAWDPTSSARLALCTGSDTVFMWTPQGCLTVQTPTHFKFSINSLSWLPTGDALLLVSDSEYCLCYLDDDDEGLVERTISVWKPPHRIPYSNELNPQLVKNIDSDQDAFLPIGVLGGGDSIDTESDNAHFANPVGDTPNWLRHHTRAGGLSNRRQQRRRSVSASDYLTCTRSSDKHHQILSSTSRQVWNAPSANNRPAENPNQRGGETNSRRKKSNLN